MRKMKFTYYLLLSVLLLSTVSCIHDDDNSHCTTEHGLRFYAINREGVNEFSKVIQNIQLSAYQQNTFIETWKLPAQPYVEPSLPEGDFRLLAFANLNDSMSYDEHLTHIQLKEASDGYYQQGVDLFFGEKTYMSRPDKYRKVPVNDSIFLNRAMGKVRVIINNIPLNPKDYKCEVIVSGTAIGIDGFNQPIPQPVKVLNTGKIVNKRMLIDVVCFPSLQTLTVETNLRNLLLSSQDYQLNRTLNELVTPNKLIILEYDYQSSGTIVELHITIVDWDDKSENTSEEAS